MDISKFKTYVLEGNFELATKEIGEFNNQILDELFPILYEKPDICFYGFVAYSAHTKVDAHLHYLASEILVSCFPHFVGAYNLAFYHAKQAISFSPKDISYYEHLLLFYNIPEKLLSKEEAVNAAKFILSINADNKIAKNI